MKNKDRRDSEPQGVLPRGELEWTLAILIVAAAAAYFSAFTLLL